MREHIHVPAHDEPDIQPAWNEPSRDADGIVPLASLLAMTPDELREELRKGDMVRG